jgi:hypothetical protein
MTTRLSILFVLALAAGGCTQREVISTSAAADELQPLVGQSITVTGEFRLPGKLGPYITTSRGQIYVLPSSFASEHYAQMDRQQISATGVLHHQHYERPLTPSQSADVPVAAPPQDHYYFQAASTQIKLLRP